MEKEKHQITARGFFTHRYERTLCHVYFFITLDMKKFPGWEVRGIKETVWQVLPEKDGDKDPFYPLILPAVRPSVRLR
jgi:hypothetical protein